MICCSCLSFLYTPIMKTLNFIRRLVSHLRMSLYIRVLVSVLGENILGTNSPALLSSYKDSVHLQSASALHATIHHHRTE